MAIKEMLAENGHHIDQRSNHSICVGRADVFPRKYKLRDLRQILLVMFLGVMELRRSNPIEWQLTGSHFDLLIFRCC
jgi:hypothetical protein